MLVQKVKCQGHEAQKTVPAWMFALLRVLACGVCRFCVVLVRPALGPRAIVPRSSRVTDALRRVERDNDCPRVDILSFTQFVDKRWTLYMDCVPLEQVSDTDESLQQ